MLELIVEFFKCCWGRGGVAVLGVGRVEGVFTFFVVRFLFVESCGRWAAPS